MNQNLRVNKTNFHMKGFALGLALKQRRNATRKSPITLNCENQTKKNEVNFLFQERKDRLVMIPRATFTGAISATPLFLFTSGIATNYIARKISDCQEEY